MPKDIMKLDLGLPASYPPADVPPPSENGGMYEQFIKAKAELPDEVTLIRPIELADFPQSAVNSVYVSPNGDDSADGSEASPVATVAEAVNRMAGKGGGAVILRGGMYEFAETLNINSAHSGRESSPLFVAAYPGEKPVISASFRITAADFAPLDDPAMAARLHGEAAQHVLVADLGSLGYKEIPTITARSGEPILAINGERMHIARYPNAGEPNIPMSRRIIEVGGCTVGTSMNYNRDHKKNIPWTLGLDDERPFTWQWNDDIWLFGALYAEWARDYQRVASLDAAERTMTGAAPSPWGVQFEGSNNYYFLNVFEELDSPGEWFYDHTSGKLYLWPEKELAETDDIRIMSAPRDLIHINDAEYVVIDGLDLGRVCGSCIRVNNSHQVLIERCDLICAKRYGVNISGGDHCGAVYCNARRNGVEGIAIEGGDRAHLIPANNFIQNCVVADPYTKEGIVTSGCGNVVSHNLLVNCTMTDNGSNEGIIEYNEFNGGWHETNDSGMIYISGGGLSTCGAHIRYNYLHSFRKCGYGIYCDDLSRGKYIYGNIVVGNGPDIEAGYRCYNIHNGGEHVYMDNIAINPGWFGFGGDLNYYYDGVRAGPMWPVLADSIIGSAADKRNEIYMGRYPNYREFIDCVDEYMAKKDRPDYVRGAAEDRIRSAAHIHIERNVVINAPEPFHFTEIARETMTGLDRNFVWNGDPGFVDMNKANYNLCPDSYVYRALPDFIAPPFDKMGLAR